MLATLPVNLSGLVGYTGGHDLGNFSVTKQRGEQGTGFSAKLKDLREGIDEYKVVVESGGKVIPGGHQTAAFAAKGLWDDERAPGRTWVVTGMGANAESCEVWSATGGRGKTMKFFRNPIVSCRYLDTRGYAPTMGMNFPMTYGVGY
jgi:hypothetical protein